MFFAPRFGLGNDENLIKPTKHVLQKSILLVRNPYKTCLQLMIMSQKRKKASKWSKSITFIDETHTVFSHVRKSYKTNEKRGFSKAKNALRKPL